MHNTQTARHIATHGDCVSFELLFTLPEAILSQWGDYTSVSIGIFGPRGKVGDPALPWRRIYVLIPNGSTFHRVTFELGKVARLASGALIQPIQPLIHMALRPLPPPVPFQVAGPNSEVYASRDAWPETPIYFAGMRRLGGLQMAQLDVCPFQYFPARRELELVQELRVRLEFRRADAPPASSPPSAAGVDFKRRMTERVAKMVINPRDPDLAVNNPLGT